MPNASDIIFDTLEAWGVDVVFGLPGDGINGLMEALRKRQDRIRFVLVRHEEAAAFAACAYAKLTGKLGVCIATTGPGGIHLLNGLYDAKLDNTPVLAITGNTYTDLQHSSYQQDVDMVRLYSDVADYTTEVMSPTHARLATDLAIRTALARRGVGHITVPIDVQEAEFEGDYSKHRVKGGGQTSQAPVGHATVPPADALQRAADLINAAERPVLLVGQGALGASSEVIALAERLNAPIVKSLLGKDVVPDEHPLDIGGLGLLGTKPAVKAMESTDLLLMIGTSFPYGEFLPKSDQAKGIQIEIDPARVGLRWPVDVGLVGTTAETLHALTPLISARGTTDWLTDLQGEMRDWWGLMEDRGTRTEFPMKPQVVAWELGKRLADDAIVLGDSGTNTTWIARYWKAKAGQRFTCSGTLATMAPALPYAIAAQVAYPERQVVAFMGDGALMMLAGELSSIVQHDLPIKIVVIRNDMLGMIRWEQMVFLGNPSFGVRFTDKTDFVKVAEGFGMKGYRVDRAEDMGSTIDAALAHPGPALIEAVVDPNEPPHPPQIKAEQALRMGQSLARGEPNATRIGLTLFRDKVKDLFGGGGEEREAPSRVRRS